MGKFVRVAEQVGQYSVELVFIRSNQAGIRRTVNHEAIAAPGADAGYGIVHHLIQPEGGNIDFNFSHLKPRIIHYLARLFGDLITVIGDQAGFLFQLFLRQLVFHDICGNDDGLGRAGDLVVDGRNEDVLVLDDLFQREGIPQHQKHHQEHQNQRKDGEHLGFTRVVLNDAFHFGKVFNLYPINNFLDIDQRTLNLIHIRENVRLVFLPHQQAGGEIVQRAVLLLQQRNILDELVVVIKRVAEGRTALQDLNLRVEDFLFDLEGVVVVVFTEQQRGFGPFKRQKKDLGHRVVVQIGLDLLVALFYAAEVNGNQQNQ